MGVYNRNPLAAAPLIPDMGRVPLEAIQHAGDMRRQSYYQNLDEYTKLNAIANQVNVLPQDQQLKDEAIARIAKVNEEIAQNEGAWETAHLRIREEAQNFLQNKDLQRAQANAQEIAKHLDTVGTMYQKGDINIESYEEAKKRAAGYQGVKDSPILAPHLYDPVLKKDLGELAIKLEPRIKAEIKDLGFREVDPTTGQAKEGTGIWRSGSREILTKDRVRKVYNQFFLGDPEARRFIQEMVDIQGGNPNAIEDLVGYIKPIVEAEAAKLSYEEVDADYKFEPGYGDGNADNPYNRLPTNDLVKTPDYAYTSIPDVNNMLESSAPRMASMEKDLAQMRDQGRSDTPQYHQLEAEYNKLTAKTQAATGRKEDAIETAIAEFGITREEFDTILEEEYEEKFQTLKDNRQVVVGPDGVERRVMTDKQVKDQAMKDVMASNPVLKRANDLFEESTDLAKNVNYPTEMFVKDNDPAGIAFTRYLKDNAIGEVTEGTIGDSPSVMENMMTRGFTVAKGPEQGKPLDKDDYDEIGDYRVVGLSDNKQKLLVKMIGPEGNDLYLAETPMDHSLLQYYLQDAEGTITPADKVRAMYSDFYQNLVNSEILMGKSTIYGPNDSEIPITARPLSEKEMADRQTGDNYEISIGGIKQTANYQDIAQIILLYTNYTPEEIAQM